MEVLTIQKGNIYISSAQYETYFGGVEAVVLLKRENVFLLMPVQNASGGLLLKIRNADGDRVVHAAEFFMLNDVECQEPRSVDASWNTDLAALILNI